MYNMVYVLFIDKKFSVTFTLFEMKKYNSCSLR